MLTTDKTWYRRGPVSFSGKYNRVHPLERPKELDLLARNNFAFEYLFISFTFCISFSTRRSVIKLPPGAVSEDAHAATRHPRRTSNRRLGRSASTHCHKPPSRTKGALVRGHSHFRRSPARENRTPDYRLGKQCGGRQTMDRMMHCRANLYRDGDWRSDGAYPEESVRACCSRADASQTGFGSKWLPPRPCCPP